MQSHHLQEAPRVPTAEHERLLAGLGHIIYLSESKVYTGAYHI